MQLLLPSIFYFPIIYASLWLMHVISPSHSHHQSKWGQVSIRIWLHFDKLFLNLYAEHIQGYYYILQNTYTFNLVFISLTNCESVIWFNSIAAEYFINTRVTGFWLASIHKCAMKPKSDQIRIQWSPFRSAHCILLLIHRLKSTKALHRSNGLGLNNMK